MSLAISLDSPVGRLVVIENNEAIAAIRWSPEWAEDATPLLREARTQLEAYFARRLKRFDLPVAPAGSAFDRRVWAAMQQIGYGRTQTYGDIAIETGSGPRAVGGACARNPIPIVIPCHRVLARGGLGGYGGGSGLATKQTLLALEGAIPPPASSLRAKRGNLAERTSIRDFGIAASLRSSR